MSEYEDYVSIKAFEAGEIPASDKPLQWLKEAQSVTLSASSFFYSSSIIDAIDARYSDPAHKIILFLQYHPPVGNFTNEDFFACAEELIQEHTHQSYGGYYGGRNENRKTYYYFGGSWLPKILRPANNVVVEKLTQKPGNSDYSFKALLKNQTERTGGLAYLRELVQLNDFIASDFGGSFEEYLVKHPIDANALDSYVFKDTEFLAKLVYYAYTNNVATFSPAAQKRTRKLLLAQPQEVWKLIIENSPRYSKGKTHQQAVAFIENIVTSLDPTSKDELLSAEDARKALILNVTGACAEAATRLTSPQLSLLLTTSTALMPNDHQFKNYHREYAKILAAIKDKTFTLEDHTAILLAIEKPSTWLRNNRANAPLLLLELLEQECCEDFVKLLKRVIFEYTQMVPTETEWRATKEMAQYAVPTDWFMATAVASPKRDETKGAPDEIKILRRAFAKRKTL